MTCFCPRQSAGDDGNVCNSVEVKAAYGVRLLERYMRVLSDARGWKDTAPCVMHMQETASCCVVCCA